MEEERRRKKGEEGEKDREEERGEGGEGKREEERGVQLSATCLSWQKMQTGHLLSFLVESRGLIRRAGGGMLSAEMTREICWLAWSSDDL